MTMSASTDPTGATCSAETDDDIRFDRFLATVQERFAHLTEGGAPLFTTSARGGLFEAFLAGLPLEHRQHYTCNACRTFVERFGGLVTVLSDGAHASVLWDPSTSPPFYRGAVRSMEHMVAHARIDGVFLCDAAVWGVPHTTCAKAPGSWRHLAIGPRKALVFQPTPLQTAGQAMAEKLQEHGMLARGLADFPLDVVRQAHTLLTTGGLYRSEKCIGVAKWLLDLHEARAGTMNSYQRDNLTWRAVATAPVGFCHVRSTMIGTLLEDLLAGLSFHQIKARFDEKTHPLQYQRPQAAPSDGQIAAAEKVIQVLASAGALTRRFARLDDIQALWKPAAKPDPEPKRGDGVFGHLKTPSPARLLAEPPTVTMTWEKFARIVLPEAERIEFYAPHDAAGYVGLVTAVDPAAPPMLQWDYEEHRNPVSWYFYSGGRRAEDWNLKPSTFHQVTAVTFQPSMWRNPQSFLHQGEKVFFLLEGARDLGYQAGAGFFPEILRSEYHAIRATLEAYAKGAVVQDIEKGSAFGIGLLKGQGRWGLLFRVTSKSGVRITYVLDRWD